jgi:hypothetical protein
MSYELPFALPSVDSPGYSSLFLSRSFPPQSMSLHRNQTRRRRQVGRRSHPLNHAQRCLVLLDPAQQFVPFRTRGKMPGLPAHYLDLIAQAIGLRCLAHCRIRPGWPDIRNVRGFGRQVSRSRKHFPPNAGFIPRRSVRRHSRRRCVPAPPGILRFRPLRRASSGHRVLQFGDPGAE